MTPVQKEAIVDLTNNTKDVLGATTLEKLKERLEEIGFDVKLLGRGKHKNVSFEDGGGYRINYDGDGYFQYHPKEGSYHEEAYYKIPSGSMGIRRFKLNGEKKED